MQLIAYTHRVGVGYLEIPRERGMAPTAPVRPGDLGGDGAGSDGYEASRRQAELNWTVVWAGAGSAGRESVLGSGR